MQISTKMVNNFLKHIILNFLGHMLSSKSVQASEN